MPERPPPHNAAESRGPRPGAPADPDASSWRLLTEAQTAEELSAPWAELQARLIGGVTLALVVLDRDLTGTPVPTALYPRGERDPSRLAGVVDRVLRERKGVVVRSDSGQEEERAEDLRFHLAFPILVSDRCLGAAAFAITPRPPIQLQTAMRQLQWGVAWLQNWFLRRAAEPEARAARRLQMALDLAAAALEPARFQPAATRVVTELATRLPCDRASIGFVRRAHVRVVALSHSARFERQMNLVRAIGFAMGESVDQRAVLRHPPLEGDALAILRFHEQLARLHGDGSVLTAPFFDATGGALGALTVERAANAPFDHETEELVDAVAALVGPILETRRCNDRNLVVQAGVSLWTQVRNLFGPRHVVLKLSAAGVVALSVFFAFATGTHRVKAKTRLEGEVQRVIAAPYRGFIGTAEVRPGDVVREGQVLCTLDDRDLRLEQSKLRSEREQLLVEHRRSMAEGEAAATRVVSKKMGQTEAQLALLKEQLERARITAPFAGLVLNGDLSQSLGAPVETGQILFAIAPLDTYRLILKVDEKDIGYLQVGQKGDVILTAIPEARHPFEVVAVTPVSVTEEGGNFFRVEARLERVSERLRPGMEGFAKVEVGRAHLIWIWTHDMFEWIRLKLWSWLP